MKFKFPYGNTLSSIAASAILMASVSSLSSVRTLAQEGSPDTPPDDSETPEEPEAQSTFEASKLAASSVVASHNHSIILRDQDIDNLIALLPSDAYVIAIQSSSGQIGGSGSGIVHTHSVFLRRYQLIQLKNTGFLQVESQPTLGHSHLFSFFNTASCPSSMPTERPQTEPQPEQPTPEESPAPDDTPGTQPEIGSLR